MGIPNPWANNSVAIIAGPTASGKTALALYLAHSLRHGLGMQRDCVIINADSAQVYVDLPILSAQPTPAEQSSAPHRLFGYLDGAETCSAARWAHDAKQEIASAHASGALPILVGGTGLYHRTLLDGIAPMPPIDENVRRSTRTLSTPDAWTRLQVEDVRAAAALHPNDDSRIKRALEVIRSTGQSIIDWRSEKTGGILPEITLHPLLLLPPRAQVHARCDARFAGMVRGEKVQEAGARGSAVSEVLNLLKRNLPADAPILRAIGFSEMAAYLNEDIDEDTAIQLGQIATRQYAKRQYTWFRNQSPAHWPRWDSEINDENMKDIVTLFQ